MNTDEIMALATAYADERVLAVRGRSTEQDVVAADAALRTAIEALVADAERYRWLRDQREDDGIAIVMKNKHINDDLSYAENINTYIDAARSKT